MNFDGRDILFLVSHSIAYGIIGRQQDRDSGQIIRKDFVSFTQAGAKKIFQGFMDATMRRSMRRNPTMKLIGTMTGDPSGI